MTKRLYYDNSEMHEFDSVVDDVAPASSEPSRPAIILRETAFYPTSGGQVHDTGWLTLGGPDPPDDRLRVTGVAESEDGRIVHYLEAPLPLPPPGTAIHGSIDADRRRDEEIAALKSKPEPEVQPQEKMPTLLDKFRKFMWGSEPQS